MKKQILGAQNYFNCNFENNRQCTGTTQFNSWSIGRFGADFGRQGTGPVNNRGGSTGGKVLLYIFLRKVSKILIYKEILLQSSISILKSEFKKNYWDEATIESYFVPKTIVNYYENS